MLGSAKVRMVAVGALAMCSQTTNATGALVREGRSVTKACSPNAMVCAVLKDGSMQPTDECAAQLTPTARILPGDCFDAD